MKRALPILLSLTLLAGCAQNAARPIHPPAETSPTLDSAVPSEAEGAYAAFGLELLRSSRHEGESILLSPLSVSLALGMTANGADRDTLDAFQELFGMDRDTLNALCAAMLADYGSLGGSTQATLANSLWVDPRLTLADGFAARCTGAYDAQLYEADFLDSGTVKAVNDWADQQTKGLIPAVVDRFSPDTVLALVNAIYLKNQFSQPFPEPHSDWTLDFTAEDGTVSQPKGMNNGVRAEQYIATPDGQGVLLPYDDGRLGFLLMLPREGASLTDYLAGWDGDTVRTLLDSRMERMVELTLPKFKAEWGESLKEILTGMGLAEAFDPNAADFSALGTAQEGTVYLGDVVHKAALEVNEMGTEAAAVTAAMMFTGSAMPAEELVTLTFDRPFVYAIVDLEQGIPLFLGTMERGT